MLGVKVHEASGCHSCNNQCCMNFFFKPSSCFLFRLVYIHHSIIEVSQIPRVDCPLRLLYTPPGTPLMSWRCIQLLRCVVHRQPPNFPFRKTVTKDAIKICLLCLSETVSFFSNVPKTKYCSCCCSILQFAVFVPTAQRMSVAVATHKLQPQTSRGQWTTLICAPKANKRAQLR